jgi:hypothetical protein
MDYSRGIVHLSSGFDDKFVKVTYSAGFSGTNKAPDYLKEAMLTFVSEIMGGSHGAAPNTAASPDTSAVGKNPNNYGYSVSKMLEPYMRGYAFQIRPLW